MSFPNAYSQMIRNDAGEVLGWDNPPYDPPEPDDGFGPEPYDEEDEDEHEEDEYRPHEKHEHTLKCNYERCESYLEHFNAQIIPGHRLAWSWYYDMIEEINQEALLAEGRMGYRLLPEAWEGVISYQEFMAVTNIEEIPKEGSREDYVLTVVGNACGTAYVRPELGGLGVNHANALRGAFL